MTLPEKHFNETRDLLKAIDKHKIANWLLKEGYFPEQNILPPSFKVDDFTINSACYLKDFRNPPRKKIIHVSYPKSLLISRVFGIQHPYHYHDIVYLLIENWDSIIDHIFNKDTVIYTYSLPIKNIGDGSSFEGFPYFRNKYWIFIFEVIQKI